jgi:hypothetical protein
METKSRSPAASTKFCTAPSVSALHISRLHHQHPVGSKQEEDD